MESWVVRAEDLVGEQRTDPSLAWLVPQKGFWSEDDENEIPDISDDEIPDIDTPASERVSINSNQ